MLNFSKVVSSLLCLFPELNRKYKDNISINNNSKKVQRKH